MITTGYRLLCDLISCTIWYHSMIIIPKHTYMAGYKVLYGINYCRGTFILYQLDTSSCVTWCQSFKMKSYQNYCMVRCMIIGTIEQIYSMCESFQIKCEMSKMLLLLVPEKSFTKTGVPFLGSDVLLTLLMWLWLRKILTWYQRTKLKWVILGNVATITASGLNWNEKNIFNRLGLLCLWQYFKSQGY